MLAVSFTRGRVGDVRPGGAASSDGRRLGVLLFGLGYPAVHGCPLSVVGPAVSLSSVCLIRKLLDRNLFL